MMSMQERRSPQPLRFHWRLLQGGEDGGATRANQLDSREAGIPNLPAQIDFCRAAERNGIDSLLTDFNFAKPDPMMLATALGLKTSTIRFMVAIRSGIISPTLFVQQVNTLSVLTKGRIHLNVVAGHSPEEQRFYGDWLSHDERYARTEEFLEICRGLWARNGGVHFAGKYFRVEDARVNTPFVSTADQPPEIFVSGGSQAARNLAARHGTCWMTMGDTPERIGQEGKPILQAGKELGIRLSIICESTREKAIRTAQAIVDRAQSSARNFEEERRFVRQSDSQSMGIRYAAAESEWLGHWLWSGAVRIYGAPAIAIVGTPEIAASAMLEYKRVGVTHFILSGWPKREAMERFGREVLPLVRELEKKELVLA